MIERAGRVGLGMGQEREREPAADGGVASLRSEALHQRLVYVLRTKHAQSVTLM